MKLVIARHLISCSGDIIREEHNKGILIKGERILRITDLEEMTEYQKDPSIEIIDAGDSYVLPGLIDAHVHLCFDSSANPILALDREKEAETLLRMVSAARQELASGVTVVRDCGAKGFSILHLRDAIHNGLLDGPTIVACGPAITVTGGHCHFLGLEADNMDEVRKAVRHLCKQNVDFIKVMVSGGNMTPGSNSFIDQYDLDILRTITYEAHMRGKKVSGHVHSTRGIANAITAGFDTLEHCSFKDSSFRQDVAYSSELAERMKEHRIAVCPAMGKAYILPPGEGAPLPDKIAMWRDFQNSRFSTTEKMYQQGISIIAGTDAGCKHSFFNEFVLTLEIMHSKIHMSVADVLLSATILGARALGIDDSYGSLSENKYADLIFVPGNPVSDLSELRNVHTVIRHGKVLRHL